MDSKRERLQLKGRSKSIFPKNCPECSSKEHQHTTHTLMNYLVTYDKYLEEGVMLLNARMSFKNERAALTFAGMVKSNPKNDNIKMFQL